jgi:hypothetical protein
MGPVLPAARLLLAELASSKESVEDFDDLAKLRIDDEFGTLEESTEDYEITVARDDGRLEETIEAKEDLKM